MRWRAFSAGLAVSALAGVATAQSPPNPCWMGYEAAGRAVSVAEGRSLYLSCEGAGAPSGGAGLWPG